MHILPTIEVKGRLCEAVCSPLYEAVVIAGSPLKRENGLVMCDCGFCRFVRVQKQVLWMRFKCNQIRHLEINYVSSVLNTSLSSDIPAVPNWFFWLGYDLAMLESHFETACNESRCPVVSDHWVSPFLKMADVWPFAIPKAMMTLGSNMGERAVRLNVL